MKRRWVGAYRSGLLAETIAGLILRLKGHRIIAQRYKTPVGDIDLIALKGKRLVFVDVNGRRSSKDAAFTLRAKQRRRIVRAAQYWLSDHPSFIGHDLAFDMVLVRSFAWPGHIQNVFPV